MFSWSDNALLRAYCKYRIFCDLQSLNAILFATIIQVGCHGTVSDVSSFYVAWCISSAPHWLQTTDVGARGKTWRERKRWMTSHLIEREMGEVKNEIITMSVNLTATKNTKWWACRCTCIDSIVKVAERWLHGSYSSAVNIITLYTIQNSSASIVPIFWCCKV